VEIFVKNALCLLALAFPLATLASPLAESRQLVKDTKAYCAKLAAREAKLPQAGACEQGVELAAKEITQACRKLERDFASAVRQAEGKVAKANQWIRRASVVTDNGKSVVIHFDLTSDPGYPMHDAFDIINEGVINEYFTAVGPAKSRLKNLERACGRSHRGWNDRWKEIYGEERRAVGLGTLYTDLAHSLSDYFMEAMRSHRAGKLHEAQQELKKRTGG